MELTPAARRALVGAGLLAFGLTIILAFARSRREHVAGHAFPVPSRDDRILVEVLNASGRQGLARQATRLLRRRGLDVIYFGNAETTVRVDSTRVFSRRGEPGRAHRVAQALGGGQVVVAPDSLRRVDVTVLLGADFQVKEGLHP